MNAGEIERWLLERMAGLIGKKPDEIDPTETFAHFGLASVEVVGLLGALEDRLGVPVDQAAAYEWPTPRRLAEALAEETGGRTAPAPVQTFDETGGSVDCGDSVDPIVIVGLSCRFPGGANTPDLYWRLLTDGVDAVTQVPADRWDVDAHYHPQPGTAGASYTRRGAFLDDAAGWDAEFFGVSPQEALRTDPQQRLLLELVWEALEDAAIPAALLSDSRTAVIPGLMDSGQYTRLQLENHGHSCVHDPNFGLGCASSVAAGRISHWLNLRGPAFTVDTACSSALVAVHLAAQSLRRGEADLALAAGVSLTLHPDAHVQACAMSMLSPDGACKTFDERADGFAMGEGGGVVVLERMSDALRQGHRIHAVVRGSAVNQDGRSNGLTAPNRAAQIDVMRRALAAAEVTPGEIGYVEAHGSGTRLGDAIELGALQEVFGAREADRPLLVGAVKTNIGHTLAAAGMAGLIKTVLALRAGELPPSLHLDQPVAAVSDGGPVRPLTERTLFPGGPSRRMGGVSSFGWSGTNAHVVLEETPPATEPATEPDASPQLLTLSAQSPAALAAHARRLAEKFRSAPRPDLADVAYTLQTGRTRSAVRRALLCHDWTDALSALTGDPGLAGAERCRPGRPKIAFLLPGVGDQYVGLGQRLYGTEAVFRDAVDTCAATLRARSGVDLHGLFAAPAPSAGRTSPSLASLLGRETDDGAVLLEEELSRPEVIHALIFTVEFALAKLLGSWGISPDALLGYSLGEYTAACLAGVFTLDDALHLVVERARLVDRHPAGAMFAVAAGEQDAQKLLDEVAGEVSVAAVNGPSMTVVAGSEQAVADVQRVAALRGVAGRRLRTTHAFHSPLLEPARKRLHELVASVDRWPTSVPIVSNLTGTWLTAEQAVSPGYWADHLCRTVRFADGARLLSEYDALVEVGPAATLGSLVRQNQAARPDAAVLSTLPAALAAEGEGTDERESLRRVAGELWELGADIDWPALHGRRRATVSLPVYPFQRTRFWPDPVDGRAGPGPERGTRKSPRNTQWCYVPHWERDTGFVPAGGNPGAELPDAVLVFADPSGIGSHLTERFRAAGSTAIAVTPGETYAAGDGTATIDPGDPEHYRALLDGPAAGHDRVHVVHTWSLLPPGRPGRDGALRGALGDGFASLLLLVQAIGEQWPAKEVRLLTVSAGSADVLGGDAPAPQRAVVHGLGRVVRSEHPTLGWSGVDLDGSAPERDAAEAAGHLFAELTAAEPDHEPGALTAWRRGRRWRRIWQPLPADPASLPVPGRWRPDGVYLVTGGTRGLGMALARHLVRQGVRRLALVARTPLPPRAEWRDTAAEDCTVRDLLALEAEGAEVLVLTADAGRPEQLREALRTARTHFGALHGVVHCAGVPGEGLISRKTREQAEAVLAPKALGTAPLLELVGPDAPPGERLELLVLYSSSVTVLGGLGESDYCAANTVLDAAAEAVDGTGSRVLSVAWGPWQHDAWQSTTLAGVPALAEKARDYRERYGIGEERGVALLDRLLATGHNNVLVLGQPLREAAEFWAALADVNTLTAPRESGAQRYGRPHLRAAFVAPRTELERQVAAVWEQFLGIDGIGVDDPFFDLGGNSLVGMSMVRVLGQALGVDIAPAVLFAHPTVADLARWAAEATGQSPRRAEAALATSQARGESRRRARRSRAAADRRRGETT